MIKTPHVDSTFDEDATAINNTFRNVYVRELRELLRRAAQDGYVITVELKPCAPLAMGNYRMVGNVRGAR
jgi:hypothetical protein